MILQLRIVEPLHNAGLRYTHKINQQQLVRVYDNVFFLVSCILFTFFTYPLLLTCVDDDEYFVFLIEHYLHFAAC